MAAAGILLDIDLPGLYMDAVNPDFMAAKILGSTALTTTWVMPGNLFFGRFPLLPALYYGSGMAWLGAPFYALFGMDIFSIRLMHGIYALGVLTSMLLLLRKVGAGSIVLLLTGIVIALDPSFIFSFRTQFYINATPLIAFLLGILFLESAPTALRPHRALFFSGLLYAISFYGYFIYAFFFPGIAIALFTLIKRTNGQLTYKTAIGSWCIGVIVGALPYIVGYFLIIDSVGGTGAFLEYFRAMQKSLGSPSEVGRFQAAWSYYVGVSNHSAQSFYWVGGYAPIGGGNCKAVLLLVAPVVFWLVAEWRKTPCRWSRLAVGCALSYLMVALMFGARLGSHHFIPIYLFLHLVLAITLYEATFGLRLPGAGINRYGVAAMFGIAFSIPLVLAVQNIYGQIVSRTYLRESGGVGLYSDAITRFSNDILVNHRTALHMMPDWGLWMPAVFLTGGKVDIIADENMKHARWLLCTGRPVRWAFITGDRATRFADVTRRLNWDAPKIESWRQRNGAVVFEVATFSPNVFGTAEQCNLPKQ